MWRKTPIIVLMNLNAIANFSLWWHKRNISSTSCNTKFIFVTYSTVCINLDNLFSFTWTSIISVGLCHSIQMHAPHYSFQYKCNFTISWHHFPFSTIQHSYWHPTCQQHTSLIAPHNMQHFHVHVQELVYHHVLSSVHFHKFYTHQAKKIPMKPKYYLIVFHEHK
jgi:hypothetical protein